MRLVHETIPWVTEIWANSLRTEGSIGIDTDIDMDFLNVKIYI